LIGIGPLVEPHSLAADQKATSRQHASGRSGETNACLAEAFVELRQSLGEYGQVGQLQVGDPALVGELER
jgi:hypothetical protein